MSDEERSDLDRELEALLRCIAKTGTINAAESKLEELGRLQQLLATVCFKYQIDLTETQRRLVREYDRWDVAEVRAAALEAIRRGQFP